MSHRWHHLIFSFLFVFATHVFAIGGNEALRPTVLILRTPGTSETNSLRTEIRSGGGRAVHVFPGAGCIAELTASQYLQFSNDPRFTIVRQDPVGEFTGTHEAVIVEKAWNLLLRHREAVAQGRYEDPGFRLQASTDDLKALLPTTPTQSASSAPADALMPPPSTFNRPRGKVRQLSSSAPFGADFYDTSEFFIGDVAVGVLILESAGNAYDWSDAEIAQTLDGIVTGMDWWATQDPRSERTFTYDLHIRVPVSVEPIQGPIADDWTWGEEVLGAMGYSTGSTWDRGKEYLNDLRDANGTDWATMMFIVDSNPAVNQGLFVGGGYAHAYFGGPWLTMARYSSWASNAGNYYTAVPAHETGHLFYATDEYNDIATRAGYFNGLDDDGGVCIMNRNTLNGVCDSSRIQVGWRYSAGDTTDILNVRPVVTLGEYAPDPSPGPDPEYIGGATAGVLANANPIGQAHAITLNSIALVEYSVDGGSWLEASPSSSPWDSGYESYQAHVLPLVNGPHMISTRATDNLGHRSELASDELTILTGDEVATSDSLLFGSGFVGVPDTLLLVVVNNTIDTANISGVSVTGAEFSFLGETPSIVNPLSWIDFHVVFLPVSPGASSGFLELTVTDPVSTTLTVQLSGQAQVRSVGVHYGWNLVSAPFTVPDRQTSTIFPTASGPAYGYAGTYQRADTLDRGLGYWLKFDAADELTLPGVAAQTETVIVGKGWNIVGSVSLPLPVSSIGSSPPAIVTSEFYGYDGDSHYSIVDSVLPGRGYWLKSSQAGALVLSATAVIPAVARINIVASDDMPPPPPEVAGGITDNLPQEYALGQNYPNPFNPTTSISYALPTEGIVQLRIFNVLGEEVALVINGFRPAGVHSVEWDASPRPGGVYFYTLRAGSYVATRKMLLIK